MEENEKKGDFVPAYAREKNDSTNIKTNVEKPKNKKIKSKISKGLIVLFFIIIVLVIAFLIYKFTTKNSNETNINYLENMQVYGFDIVYDNKSANLEETVTKSEAIKMVVVSMLNESDIKNLVDINVYIEDYQDTMTEEQIEQKLEYKNKLWVDYAVSLGIIQDGDITKENANDNVSFLETLVYFANAKIKILNKTLDVETIPNIKKFDLYKQSEQWALSDMIYNGIISEKENELKSTLTKEKLNKLVIDMVLKYNTMTVEGEKININKDKEPSNVEEYPYTLASVNKSIYELENYVANDKYKNARNSYVELKEYYKAIDSLIRDYMNTILNIDYSNIDGDKFTNDLLELSFQYENEKNIKEYIEYVKTNQIKISGSAKVQYPAIYFDGKNYRVRVKVDYKIENAIEKKNIIYGDLKSKENIIYDKNEDNIIVDVPVDKSVLSDIMFVELRPLYNIKSGSVKNDKESLKEEITENIISEEEVDHPKVEFIEDGDTLIVKPID